MRRLCTLVIVGGIFALSVVGTAQAHSAPRAALTKVICTKSVDADGRLFSVTAVMRPVTGTRHLEVLFDLLQKPFAGAFAPLVAPGLDTWISPTNPSTLGQDPKDVWRINHSVEGLPVPYVYRFRVEFKWLGKKGKVLSSRALHTADCNEPDLLPDLVVASVTIQADPGHPKKYEYLTTLENTGGTGAGPFQLQLAYGTLSGPSVFSKTIARIGAHKTQTITQISPACVSGEGVDVTADPADQVNVSTRANASDTVTCPALSATP
jgi:hypothetical protein